MLRTRTLLYLPRYIKSKFSLGSKRFLSGDEEKTVFVIARRGLWVHEVPFASFFDVKGFFMQVRVAYISQPSTDGSAKRFVVFDARAADGNNQALLKQLSEKAKHAGMDFHWAALAFMQGSNVAYYGSPALTQYLVKTKWVPSWTHTLEH